MTSTLAKCLCLPIQFSKPKARKILKLSSWPFFLILTKCIYMLSDRWWDWHNTNAAGCQGYPKKPWWQHSGLLPSQFFWTYLHRLAPLWHPFEKLSFYVNDIAIPRNFVMHADMTEQINVSTFILLPQITLLAI